MPKASSVKTEIKKAAKPKKGKTETHKKRGPKGPRVIITDQMREMVKTLRACGTRNETIARMVGMSSDALVFRFKDELEHGLDEANAKVARSLFDRAIEGDLGAQIFWLKTRARWIEKHEVSVENVNQPPLQLTPESALLIANAIKERN